MKKKKELDMGTDLQFELQFALVARLWTVNGHFTPQLHRQRANENS
jgi:hypothetical protein